MVKTARKKAVANKSSGRGSNEKKKKLPRGYKECGNCRKLLNIHKYVCDDCGHRHDMKKKKVDILKNLNKVTPKLLRSLIELNDFNDIKEMLPQSIPFSSTLIESRLSAPMEYKRRRSSKTQQNGQTALNLTADNGSNCFYAKLGNTLTAVCAVNEDIVIAEGLQKWAQFSESERITMRAYGLDKFHKMGQIYKGKSCLHYLCDKKVQYRVNIPEHIVSMKAISNRLAILTGRGTIQIFDLDNSKGSSDRIFDIPLLPLEIVLDDNDQITVHEWIKTNYSHQCMKIIVGTLMGHLYLYNISQNKIELLRFYGNAHFEAVTALAECSLGSQDETIFASGSYDGCLAIWSIHSRECLYKVEASNRKISSLVWDPGAKFIFVVRDQNQDSGVLACFFAILKSQQSVALSDAIDFRLIRSTTNCKALHHPLSSLFCLLDQYQGTLRVVQLEQLRKNSLKRKKVKREQGQKVYELSFQSDSIKMSETQVEIEPKMDQKFLPIPLIADACQNKSGGSDWVWGVTYNGFVFAINLK